MIIMFKSPRQARVKGRKFQQYSSVLFGMGLEKPEFRAIGEKDGNIVVHPDDLSSPPKEPFTLRRDIVEFLES